MLQGIQSESICFMLTGRITRRLPLKVKAAYRTECRQHLPPASDHDEEGLKIHVVLLIMPKPVLEKHGTLHGKFYIP